MLHAASAHIDRVILEAFVAGVESCEDKEAQRGAQHGCDLYALSVIEEDKAWYVEHTSCRPSGRRLSRAA